MADTSTQDEDLVRPCRVYRKVTLIGGYNYLIVFPDGAAVAYLTKTDTYRYYRGLVTSGWDLAPSDEENRVLVELRHYIRESLNNAGKPSKHKR